MPTPRRNVLKLFGTGTVLSAGLGTGTATAENQDGDSIDWDTVGEAIGKKGERKKGGVYKVTFPRTDLSVSTHDVTIKPALSFTSWAAFKQIQDGKALVLGDLVLTGDMYNEVISTLQEGEVEQTAIHKHLPDLSTPIWWTHIKGTGDPVEMAKTINNGLTKTETPMEAAGSGDAEGIDLNTDKLDKIIGSKGKIDNGVYKYSIGLTQSVTTEDVELPSAMGTAIALGFQPLGNGKAAINGDFVMTAKEVNPVIRALRENDIQVVSLHNHMLEEDPRLLFMHFWATGDATTLAKGLREGLDRATSAKGCRT